MRFRWEPCRALLLLAVISVTMSGCVPLPVTGIEPTTKASDVEAASIDAESLFLHPALSPEVSRSVAKALRQHSSEVQVVDGLALWENAFPEGSVPITLEELSRLERRRALADAGAEFLVLITPGAWEHWETGFPFYSSKGEKQEYVASVIDLTGELQAEHIKVESGDGGGHLWMPLPYIGFFVFVWEAPEAWEISQSAYEALADKVVSGLRERGKGIERVAVVGAAGEGDAAVVKLLREPEVHASAEQGIVAAIYELARSYDELEPLRKLAIEGQSEARWNAAVELASEHGDPNPLRELAEQGNREAAVMLAREYDNPAPLRRLAEAGDVLASSELVSATGETGPLDALIEKREASYYDLWSSLPKPERFTQAWHALCRAAEGGDSQAQMDVAHWHRKDVWRSLTNVTWVSVLSEVGIRPDNQIAYQWYALAARNGHADALSRKQELASTLDEADIPQAEHVPGERVLGQCVRPRQWTRVPRELLPAEGETSIGIGAVLRFRAELGDPEAQYELADRATTQATRWKWLCLAAHSGQERAQHWIAARYRAGAPQPTEQNDVEAYKWYSLATSNGDKEAEISRQSMIGELSADQIAQAQRLVTHWRPDHSECGQ